MSRLFIGTQFVSSSPYLAINFCAEDESYITPFRIEVPEFMPEIYRGKTDVWDIHECKIDERIIVAFVLKEVLFHNIRTYIDYIPHKYVPYLKENGFDAVGFGLIKHYSYSELEAILNKIPRKETILSFWRKKNKLEDYLSEDDCEIINMICFGSQFFFGTKQKEDKYFR